MANSKSAQEIIAEFEASANTRTQCLLCTVYNRDIKCNNIVCKKCIHTMLKHKNKLCPICRDKTLRFIKNDEEDSDEDDE